MKRQVIIGLGSNVGTRESMLQMAVKRLHAVLEELQASPCYETPAMLLPDSPPAWDMPFLNMAVAGQCNLSPQALLAELKAIEQLLGRQERGRWAPREIDLDILAYGEEVIEDEGLHIPHRGLLQRDFALKPLADVAPDWRWPLADEYLGKTAHELREILFP